VYYKSIYLILHQNLVKKSVTGFILKTKEIKLVLFVTVAILLFLDIKQMRVMSLKNVVNVEL